MKLAIVALIFSLMITSIFLFKKNDDSFRYVVAMYRWGWNVENLDELKDGEYVDEIMKLYEEIKSTTHGRRSKMIEYIVEKMRSYEIPPDVDPVKTANEIVDSLIESVNFFSLDLPLELLLAIIERESKFNPFATSHAYLSGEVKYPAYGLFQIWAPTFFWINDKYFSSKYNLEDLFDIDVNVRIGTAILKEIMKNVPGGSRTRNPRIRSPMLSPLSYGHKVILPSLYFNTKS